MRSSVAEVSHRNLCRQLGVLAKHWSPGMVKTRLVPCCGEHKAAALHQLFLTTTLRRFASVADRRVLNFTPEEYRANFAVLANDHWDLLLQKGEDLGARIANYFQEAFASGQQQVLLIGADTPHLPRVMIEQAFDVLGHHELVFVPSDDGGYCLIGASRPVEPLMLNIEWGSSRVWEQTQKKLDDLKWSVSLLPSWYDIDREEDLTRLLEESAKNGFADSNSHDPHLASLCEQITKIYDGPPFLRGDV